MKTEFITLDSQYSTTRRLTHTRPTLVNQPEDKIQSVLFLPENPERKAEGGLRTQGYYKHNQKEEPLISVITVVFNGAEHLEQTINSVIGQTYDNVEYIIIDGGSTDGTLDIIRKFEGQIDYWISEPDGGIYHAMNKGTSLSTGNYVNFMNAGDWFFSNEIIRLITHKKSDFVYGDHELRYPTFSTQQKALPLSEIWKGMIFSHQSLFVRTALLKRVSFDTINYSISSDYNFISNIIHDKNINSSYIGQCISSVDVIGYSTGNMINKIIEDYKISIKYKQAYYVHLYYLYKIILAVPKEFLKKNLSVQLVDSIREAVRS